MIVFVATVIFLVSALQSANGGVCETPACAETGARVMKSMNVDPCDNFFEFACRGWITKNPIPPNRLGISTGDLIEDEIEMKLHKILNTKDNDNDGKPIKLARAMYRNCMDKDSIDKLGMKPFHDMLTKLGLPQGPPSDEEAKNVDVSKIAALVAKLYDMNIFLRIFIEQNSTDSTKNQLTINQKSPASDNFDVYLRKPRHFHAILHGQRHHIKVLFEIGGAGSKTEEYTTEHMDFMTEIAKIMGTPDERIRENYSRRVVTIDKAQEMTDPHGDTWNWSTFFNILFEGTDITVDTKTDTVLLNDVRYFENLTLLLKETSPGKLARYIYGQLQFLYWETVHGITVTLPRWQACTRIVKGRFELALTAAYVEKHFDVQYKKKALEMWTDMIASADEIINELEWMDAETKEQAHKKLNAVRPFIGYPEWITNPEELNKIYDGINVFDGRLFDTYMQYHSIMGKRLLNSWKQVPDKNKWGMAGTTANTMYMSNLNAVIIAAGLLHIPMYGNEVESLNYGALGSIIGGQLIQSIDNPERPTDEHGNRRQWWSKKTIAFYREKVRCMLNQYAASVIPQLGKNFKLNGHHIHQSGIADIGGLKIAFKAYKNFKARSEPQQSPAALDKYTDEQLLFLGFAQTLCAGQTDFGLMNTIQTSPHAPNSYRVIGTLQNSDEFAQAWNCSRGSPMNPKNTCKIW